MIVLVCGGRNFTDYDLLSAELDRLHAEHRITLIVHGASRGADTLAHEWASKREVPVKWFRAEWNKFGRSAGPIRNKRMLDEEKPDLVVAFKGGDGTRDMVEQSENAGFKVEKIGWQSKP